MHANISIFVGLILVGEFDGEDRSAVLLGKAPEKPCLELTWLIDK
jgi:hypothetical protein